MSGLGSPFLGGSDLGLRVGFGFRGGWTMELYNIIRISASTPYIYIYVIYLRGTRGSRRWRSWASSSY